MMHTLKIISTLSLGLALSACVSTIAPSPRPPATGTTASTTGFRPPTVMRGSGVDSVIGAGSRALLARFGTARIDLAEGDARKLQFASDACVLDIFLYPMRANAEPVATHLEARARGSGTQFDSARCIADIERNPRR